MLKIAKNFDFRLLKGGNQADKIIKKILNPKCNLLKIRGVIITKECKKELKNGLHQIQNTRIDILNHGYSFNINAVHIKLRILFSFLISKKEKFFVFPLI